MPTREDELIVWEGRAVFVTYVKRRYVICVSETTHAVIVGQTDNRAVAIRCATRLDQYPDKIRRFAGLN